MATYNGWSNYETWMVDLWLTNDEYLDRQLAECRDVAAIKALVAEAIESELGKEPEGFIADLIQNTLDDVNWREILYTIERDDA